MRGCKAGRLGLSARSGGGSMGSKICVGAASGQTREYGTKHAEKTAYSFAHSGGFQALRAGPRLPSA